MKTKISVATANNVIDKDERSAYNASYIRKNGRIRTKNGRAFPTNTQTKWVDLEKGRVPSGEKFSGMDSLGKVLKYL